MRYQVVPCRPPTSHSLLQLGEERSNAAQSSKGNINKLCAQVRVCVCVCVCVRERERERETSVRKYPVDAKCGSNTEQAARTDVIPAAVPSMVFSSK